MSIQQAARAAFGPDVVTSDVVLPANCDAGVIAGLYRIQHAARGPVAVEPTPVGGWLVKGRGPTVYYPTPGGLCAAQAAGWRVSDDLAASLEKH